MKPKIFHCKTSKTGPTTPVTVRFTKYQSNNRLAVQLICAKAPWSPFATITVNLPDVPEELLKMWFGSQMPDKNMLAFLDTNNCPWVKEFWKRIILQKTPASVCPPGSVTTLFMHSTKTHAMKTAICDNEI